MVERVPSIKIPKPCNESWDKMEKNQKGAFCAVCCHDVIDFTSMTTEEIIAYLQKKKNEKICGRFAVDQIEKPKAIPVSLIFNKFKRAVFGFFVGLSFGSIANAATNVEYQIDSFAVKSNEHRVISGVVTDENGEPLIGVNVLLYSKDAFVLGTTTNFDGEFELKLPTDTVGLTIRIQYIAYKEKQFPVTIKPFYQLSLEPSTEMIDIVEVSIGTVLLKPRYKFKQFFKRKNKKLPTTMGCPAF